MRVVVASIALARCPCCRARIRVLPCDVLPRKVYTLGVVHQSLAEYAKGDRSLRSVAWGLGGDRDLAHSTLHAWSEGLGAYASGRRSGELADSLSFSAVLAETRRRTSSIEEALSAPLDVPPERFRSEPRRERLVASARLLRAGTLLGFTAVKLATQLDPLSAWRSWSLSWSLRGTRSALVFRTGRDDTPIEHRALTPSPCSRAPPAQEPSR